MHPFLHKSVMSQKVILHVLKCNLGVRYLALSCSVDSIPTHLILPLVCSKPRLELKQIWKGLCRLFRGKKCQYLIPQIIAMRLYYFLQVDIFNNYCSFIRYLCDKITICDVITLEDSICPQLCLPQLCILIFSTLYSVFENYQVICQMLKF